jgi:hypothetical protein
MVLAVRTMISTFDIWVLMIVMVLLLAFWLTAIFLADRSQVLASGQSWRSARQGALADGVQAEGSLPGEQTAEVPGQAAPEPIGVAGRHAREGSVPEGDVPTRTDVPAQSGGRHAVPAQSAGQANEPVQPTASAQPTESAQPAGRHAMPAQRTGDADRAERSYAGPSSADEEETERPHPSRWHWIVTRGHH